MGTRAHTLPQACLGLLASGSVGRRLLSCPACSLLCALLPEEKLCCTALAAKAERAGTGTSICRNMPSPAPSSTETYVLLSMVLLISCALLPSDECAARPRV